MFATKFSHLEFIGKFYTDFTHACLKARQCCSGRLIESEFRRATSWLKCFCEFLGSGCEASRHSENGSALRLVRVHLPGTDVKLYCDTHSTTVAFHNHTFQTPGLRYSTSLATSWPTQPSGWCHGLCGREWGKPDAHGYARVHAANDPIYRGTWRPLSGASTSRRHVSFNRISTWSARYLSLLASGTVSLASIDTPLG